MERTESPARPFVVRLCGPALWVYFDEDCGICQATVRFLRPLDAGRRLTFLGYVEPLPLPPGMDLDTLEARRTYEIVVYAPERGFVHGGARGIVEIVSALPLLRFLVWPARLPGLSHLAEMLYRLVARNRRRISAALGLNACRVRPPAGTHL
jgi:predicted DCC family thiol-disulfide oxidoreductase YuxK